MAFGIGILFAIGALVFWGFGDFLIQRSTRRIGDWEPLFIITAFGSVVLLPFVYQDIGDIFASDSTFFVLVGVFVALFASSLIDFEALKKGKLSVIAPVIALEVPVAIILAFFLINESLSFGVMFLIFAAVIGLVLVSLKSHHFSRKVWIEHGVILAVFGALFLGVSNFLVGFASRITNPLLTIWFGHSVIALLCLFYLTTNKRMGKLVTHMKSNRDLSIGISILDNLGWVSFAIAVTTIPIGIAVAMSESYIALAALLGILVNREILMNHQKIGLVVALSSVIVLATVYA